MLNTPPRSTVHESVPSQLPEYMSELVVVASMLMTPSLPLPHVVLMTGATHVVDLLRATFVNVSSTTKSSLNVKH